MKNVVAHVVTQFHKHFEALGYTSVFAGLQTKYDQQTAHADSAPIEMYFGLTSKKDGYEKVDQTQEAYFDADEEEEEIVKLEKPKSPVLEFVKGSTLQPLVPYALEDDDDEELSIRPLIKKKPLVSFAISKDLFDDRATKKRKAE